MAKIIAELHMVTQIPCVYQALKLYWLALLSLSWTTYEYLRLEYCTVVGKDFWRKVGLMIKDISFKPIKIWNIRYDAIDHFLIASPNTQAHLCFLWSQTQQAPWGHHSYTVILGQPDLPSLCNSASYLHWSLIFWDLLNCRVIRMVLYSLLHSHFLLILSLPCI